MELEHFKGKHTLSGVSYDSHKWKDSFREDSEKMIIVVDGTTYSIIEDPDDGYRSMLSEILIGGECTNTFEPIEVVGKLVTRSSHYSSEIIELIDITTGEIVCEFGTKNTDDYYPSFVSGFYPENMKINR